MNKVDGLQEGKFRRTMEKFANRNRIKDLELLLGCKRQSIDVPVVANNVKCVTHHLEIATNGQ